MFIIIIRFLYSALFKLLHLVPISLIGNETHKVINTSSLHTTPNTSLGIVQATPSKVQPSPTVHTKEALGKPLVGVCCL